MNKEIEALKEEIETIEKYNPNSDELSFLYYQLHELEKEKNDKR